MEGVGGGVRGEEEDRVEENRGMRPLNVGGCIIILNVMSSDKENVLNPYRVVTETSRLFFERACKL